MTAWPDSSRPKTAPSTSRRNPARSHPADIVILALGVRPDTTLAKTAGLEIGERGGIRVDEQMRTSDPDIFAVGDAVEVKDFVTGEWSLIALAGPANRQGRIAADVIAGRDSRYRGTQGTSIIGLFGGAAAWTGVSEKTLNAARRHRLRENLPLPEFARGILPRREADRDEGHLPQVRRTAPRRAGASARMIVDKRISALAMALQMGATIYDLEEAELCYAPQFGSAKDPVNFAGMVAARCAARRHAAQSLGLRRDGFLLDVREPSKLAVESVTGRAQHSVGQFARGSANFRATARSTSSAAPASAPTLRRASFCRTDSRPRTYQVECSCWSKAV